MVAGGSAYFRSLIERTWILVFLMVMSLMTSSILKDIMDGFQGMGIIYIGFYISPANFR